MGCATGGPGLAGWVGGIRGVCVENEVCTEISSRIIRLHVASMLRMFVCLFADGLARLALSLRCLQARVPERAGYGAGGLWSGRVGDRECSHLLQQPTR